MAMSRIKSKVMVTLLLIICNTEIFAAETNERWHVLSLEGTPVGSTHEIYERKDDKLVSTESMLMILNRLGAKIEAGLSAKSIEQQSGELIRVELEILQSEQTMKLVSFRDGEQWITRSATPGVPDQTQLLKQLIIGPRAVSRRLAELANPGDAISYHTFVSATMQPGEVRAELIGFEMVDGDLLKVIEEHLPGFPAPITRLIDDQGRNVITRMDGPFGLTETVLADQTAATLAQAGGELPEEIFENTILKTGVRLPQPRRIEYLELELSHRNPQLGWPVLDSDHQRVISQDDNTVVLAIERRHPTRSVAMNAEISPELEKFLSANSVIQSAQPELIELAQSLTEGENDRWQAALNLRRWVNENMSMDAGVVLASSSEVLENRRGTCTEFAVILTALARASGIPARYVQGYVYAHGMLAGHAWSEVLIGDEWMALDAAIVSDGSADAARFAFVWSDFNKGPGELNAGPSMQMFGQIDARVIGWRGADGSEHRFPEGAPVPQVKDSRFVDNIQGIQWSVPKSWTVVDYEKTWPSNLIAAAENAQGERVELRWITQNPWESAGIDWIKPKMDKADNVESRPFGHANSWLIKQDDEIRFVQAGLDGHWQLIGNNREQLRELAEGLLLPTS